ncbi:polysaccharide deacetylase family protein [Caldibacillus lycopersici]|uniref:Polysaccharide deacetylase family protein n=1 Tax=Perspicuibacillus lycopersici TaxID=1325689 RepID=A0AAE3IV78_9BACI|nr:polysaccharide deacetylase family protein [Perspicuibacillus lycopersici]MCU9614822.1 polysaccharide deacetylase family protein [Perspicuibacillus lycopersici]
MKPIIIFALVGILFVHPSEISAKEKIPILLYHHVHKYNGIGTEDLYVTPSNFEKQMEYLRDHGFTLVNFDHIHDLDTVKKPILITFDDGYKDNLQAFLIFRKLTTESFRPTGTIFVISDFIGRANRLSVTDIKRMVESGIISIQSHTATHPELPKITNYEYELHESKKKIQQITGKPVTALAYPYGLYNDHVIAETKKYYLFGLTTLQKTVSLPLNPEENYLLPRISIDDSISIHEFARIVEGG